MNLLSLLARRTMSSSKMCTSFFLASGSSVSDTSENAKSSTNALYFRQDQDRHNTVGNCDPIVSTERGFRRVSELFETRRGFVGSIVREGFALVMSS